MSPLTELQKTAIAYALKNPYSILACMMGTGKSRMVVEVQKQTKEKLLVVCPSYLLNKWISEFKKWNPSATVTAYRKESEIRIPETEIAIVPYSLLLSKTFQMQDPTLEAIQITSHAETLFKWAEYVAVDEAHYAKTTSANRTQALHKFIYENEPVRLSLLSGTPIKNRVAEFYSLITLTNYNPKLTDPPFLKKFSNEILFADHFSNRVEYKVGMGAWARSVIKYEGLKNVEELKQWLQGIYIKLEDLSGPKLLFLDVNLDLRDMPDLQEDFEMFMLDDTVNSTAKAQSALLKAPYTVLYVKDLLEEVDQVVVFTDHIESCEAIAKSFNVPAITGKLHPDKRTQLGLDFQAGKSEVIVATIGSFSSGVDLDPCRDLVFNDFSWVPGDNDQAIYRIKRMTQKMRPRIHNLFASPQDEKIWNTLKEKLKIIGAAT